MVYLLREIVVDDNGVLAVVTEVLSHGGTGERSKVLERALEIISGVKQMLRISTYAASEAVAATTMEYFMASFSSRVWTS